MELARLHGRGVTLTSDGITCLIDPITGSHSPKCHFVVLTENDHTMFDAGLLEKASYVVDWPGEYEVEDHLIAGVQVGGTEDGALHTMMSVTTCDRVTVAHLGDLPSMPEAKQLEKLGNVHVLLLVLTDTLKPEQWTTIIDQVSPNVVIPLTKEGGPTPIFDSILKHYGLTKQEPQAQFKMQKPEQGVDTPEFVVLTTA